MPPMKKPVKKKRIRRRKKGHGPGEALPPPPPPPVMDFAAKDPWGYNFGAPMWRLDPGVSETLRRDPKDRERERINGLIERELLLDPRRVTQGFDAEELPWGLLREEAPSPPILRVPMFSGKLAGQPARKSRRRQFFEAVRGEAKKARNGLLGIAQLHFLASKHELLTTLRARARASAFPLMLEIEDATLKEPFRVRSILQVDRIFYAIHKEPRLDRFAPPLCVADAYRLFDGKGEAAVRAADKRPLAEIVSTEAHDAPFTWTVARRALPDISLIEELGRAPKAVLRVDGTVVGGIESNAPTAAHALDVSLRFDAEADRVPLFGLLVVFLDAWLQRKLGVLGRARAEAEAEGDEEDEDEFEEVEEDDA